MPHNCRIERVDPPDGVADHLYYAGEDIDHNDLIYIGIDGCIYKVRNAIETYPPKEHFMKQTEHSNPKRKLRIRHCIDGNEYESVDCGCCNKTFFVDQSSIPERGCWTCPYCTALTVDERVKDADVIKKKFETYRRTMQNNMDDMQRALENLEK